MFPIFCSLEGFESVKNFGFAGELTRKIGRRQGMTNAVISEVVYEGSASLISKGDVCTTLISVQVEAGFNLDFIISSLFDSFHTNMFDKIMSVDYF